MRNIKIAIGVGTIAIIGGVLIFRTPSPVSGPKHSMSEQLPIQNSQKATKRPLLPSGTKNAGVKSQAPVPSASSGTNPVAFEYKKALDEYHLLSQKVFLNDHEIRQKQALLQNAQFIESLKNIFKSQTPSDDLENNQNAAVDFLMEALNGSSKEAAAAVLKSIIQNPDTENSGLDRTTRENLAGAKAEVLYKWSAQEPSKIREIQQWLPGPVSQRIWANVLSQQEMNRAESALTK